MQKKRNRYLGIILALAALVLFEFAILAANFYLSQGIDQNAEGINIAGRQRMLSQRTSKALYDAKINFNNSAKFQSSIKELKSSTELFDQTIHAFVYGGPITTASGESSEISAISDENVLLIAQNGLNLWLPHKEKIETALAANPNNQEALLEQAVQSADLYNLDLLKLMNDLTVGLEVEANARSSLLKQIQTIGFVGLSLMFFGIIFFFIRRLIQNDVQLQAARNETEQILETVDEGLFLVSPDLTISEQQSTKMKDIFNKKAAKMPLIEFLSDFVSEKDKITTKEYFDLLFDARKPEKLIGDLNPLREITLQITEGVSKAKRKIVSFGFKRVMNKDSIDSILTTVSDITKQVELREDLEKLEQENANQIKMLSMVINTDKTSLQTFISNTKNSLKKINNSLKSDTPNRQDLKNKASQVMTLAHGIKGESAALNIESISSLANKFEEKASALLQESNLKGEDFIPLTVDLNKMINITETIENIGQQFLPNSNPADNSATSNTFSEWNGLYQLAESVAMRQNKQVEFTSSGLVETPLNDDLKSYITTVGVQLLRNSICHGIETTQERVAHGKNATGRISLSLHKLKDKSYELIFKDDGKGIDKEKIVSKAIEANVTSAEQAKNISSRKLLSFLFHEGLSTTDETDEDSGRGVGMNLIAEKTKEINGKIHIKTNAQTGTTFTINIPPIESTSAQIPQEHQLSA